MIYHLTHRVIDGPESITIIDAPDLDAAIDDLRALVGWCSVTRIEEEYK